MQTKLTLRLNAELIKKAKIYARQKSTSVSKLVEKHESANAVCVDGIVTRNLTDFKKSVLPVFGPDELVMMLLGNNRE